MSGFVKGVLFVASMAGIYKLGVLRGQKTNVKIIIETDDELREILEQLRAKLNKKES